ncbi:MAG: hypothetical protein QNL24_12645 [Akkermansiaceae bacterium]
MPKEGVFAKSMHPVGGTYGQISDWQVANHFFTVRGEPKVVDEAGTKANLRVILKTLIRLVSVILPNILGVVPRGIRKTEFFSEAPAVEVNSAPVVSCLKSLGGKTGFSLSAMVVAAGTGTLDGPLL